MPLVTGVFQIRGVYRISLDGREELKLDKRTFAKLGIEVDDEVDMDELIERAEKEQYERAYDAALGMLDRSAKPSAGIKRSLMEKGYLESVADRCVKRLARAGLIDDTAFARRMAQSNKSASKSALRMKMLQKGLTSADADIALAEVGGEAGTLARLADKLQRKYLDQDPREARRKLAMALARRGFSWDDINACVERLYSDEDECE